MLLSNLTQWVGSNLSEKEAIKIFVDSYPCWFDGCEDIRKAYKDEVERTLGPDGCTSCKKGAILRKYLKQAVDAL